MGLSDLKVTPFGLPKIKKGSWIRIGGVRALNIYVDHHFNWFQKRMINGVSVLPWRMTVRNNAKITTPLVKKEGKTVTDYEYLFSMNLPAKLKEKIQGAIYVKVNENDSLVIKVTRRDGNNFDVSFTDFANRMLNGLTTDYAAYEVVQKYKKFVMTQFFK